jgi:hypothetical protein
MKSLTMTALMLSLILLTACPADNPDPIPGDTPSDAVSDTAAPQDSSVADVAVDTSHEDTGPQCPEPGTTSRPSGRSEVFGIMDPQRRRLVFFGGDDGAPVNCNPAPHPIGGTWIYDTVCAGFEEVQTSNGPGPRARGVSVYDPVNDRMVIFGGRYRAGGSGPYTLYDEVWALDLETLTWEKIETNGVKPVARFNPAGGYNALTGEMIIFGGTKGTSGMQYDPLADTWALNLETHTWRQIQSTNNPEPRVLHTATVDSDNNRLFIYGGTASFFAAFFGDLWVMDLATGQWEKLHPGGFGAPVGRIWPTITWDRVGERMLLFGGHDSGSVGNNNDTWMFDPPSKTWVNLTPPETVNQPANEFCSFPPDFTVPNMEAPDRRGAQLAALDETRGEWVIFGGKTDCGLIDDVWVFSLEQDGWVNLIGATMGESCIRGDNPQLCVAMCK